MKLLKSKRPARRTRRKFSRQRLRIRLPLTWRVTVTKSGAFILPREALAQIGFWEGDELEACVRHFAGSKFISLEVRPHGLTRSEIESAARHTQRQIAQARKTGRLVPLSSEGSARHMSKGVAVSHESAISEKFGGTVKLRKPRPGDKRAARLLRKHSP